MGRWLLLLGFFLGVASNAQPAATRVPPASKYSAVANTQPAPAASITAINPVLVNDEARLNAERAKWNVPKVSGVDAIVLDKGRAPAGNSSSVMLDAHALQTKLGVSSAMLYRVDQPMLNVTPATGPIALGTHDILAVRRNLPATVIARQGGGVIASSSTLLFVNSHETTTRALALEYKSSDLIWIPSQAQFVGELLIGVVDLTDATVQEQLNTPIPVQLVGPIGAIKPTQLAIDHVGGAFLPVVVTSDGDEDPFKVQFRSRFDSQLPAADLHYIRPRLTFSAPNSIPGFGLGSADVTVGAIGAPLHPGQTVMLDLDNGWVASRTLVADARGMASTRLRSIGLGGGTLRLVPGVYVADPKTIAFVWPWAFLIATVLGAALGATVYVYRLRRKAPRSRRRYWLDWWVGCFIGIGATGMAYAGMHLPEFIPMPDVLVGETVPFALAFICAAIGSALISAVAGPGTKVEE